MLRKFRALYWDIRWFFWDRYEHRTVAGIAHYMHRHKIVYVHPDPWAPAKYVVLSLEAWEECSDYIEDLDPHTHIEGFKAVFPDPQQSTARRGGSGE